MQGLKCIATALLAVLTAWAQSDPAQGQCLLLGPDVPASRHLANSRPFQEALQNLTDTINTSLDQGSFFGQLNNNDTSFIVDIWSIHGDDNGTSVYNFTHSAPSLSAPSSGVAEVDDDTVFRIGSMSKLLTVYIFLIAAGDASWSDPITRYVPELAAYAEANRQNVKSDGIGYFDWDSVTLGALASQQGGIFRDYAFGADSDNALVSLGLPVVEPVNGTFCGGDSLLKVPCDRACKSTDVRSSDLVGILTRG